MKRATVVCMVGLLALTIGCWKRGDKLIRLTTLPEIDTSALDPYVEITNKEISSDRVWVILQGKAKQPLGGGLQINVQRFTGEGPLDTVTTSVVMGGPVPLGPFSPRGAERKAPTPEERAAVRPGNKGIEQGDEILIRVDATTTKSKITKLQLSPVTGGRY